MWNGHIMFIYIYIEHRNLEIRKKRNDFSVQVRNFLLPFSLKILRHKGRDAHSFYPGFFICPPPTRVAPATEVSASKRKSTEFFRWQDTTQLTYFFKIPKSSSRFRCVTSFALACSVSHLGYCDISERHVHSACARVNTCVNVAPK